MVTSLLAAVSVPVARSQVQFFTPPGYTGDGQIFVADFNGDGKPDILTADGTLNLGSGNGTFTTGTPVPGTPIAVADFNGDGIPDVLEQGTDTLLVLLGNGNGTFQPAITTNSNANLYGVIAGDLNGDGKADVLGLYNNNLVVYLSNGNGTFAAGVSYPVGDTSFGAEPITLGDFNGDGKVDVAVSLSGDNVAGEEVVFLGNGDGTFQTGKTSTGVTYPISVVAGDFNGDGKLDLVIAGTPACNGTCAPITTSILLGNGDGTFQAPATIFSNSGPLAAGDVNGDGKLDLVLLNIVTTSPVSSPAQLVQVYLGNGDGTFSNPYNYFPAPTSYSGVGLALADFNRDGNLDVAASNNVLLGNGNGTFQGWTSVWLPNPISAAVAGIFVKNGAPDLAALSSGYSDTTLYILTNDGTGTLTTAHTYDLQQLGSAIATADVNGDGNLDLVVQGSDLFEPANWSYIVLLGNGDGSFQPPVVYPQDTGGGSGVLIVDFNGDGKPDLAFPAGDQAVAVLLGNGNGTFAAPAYYYVGAGEGTIVSADFNNDGKLDIASAGTSLALLLGNGNGTFQAATFPAANLSAGLLTATLTSSGNADLVSGTWVDLGNGNGTFTALTGALPSGMYATGLADINGDGKPDAIGFSFGLDHGTSLGVALGNGDGTFGPYITVVQSQPSNRPGLLAVADMNGNGKQDLVVGDGNDIFVMLNTTVPVAGTSFSPASLTFPSQTVGSSSAAMPVTLTNSGAVVLSVTGVIMGGADAGDFSQTNNCTTVQPLATCTMNVTFTPAAAGTVTANLTVSDNAGTGSQLVVVSGTGVAASGFTFGPGSGGSSSSTISAGQTATFNLALTPAGSFSGTVNLTCSIGPATTPAPVCSVPSSVSVTGSSATPVTVTVATTAPGSAGSSAILPPGALLIEWTLVWGASGLLLVRKSVRPALCAPMIVLAFLVMTGCVGSSSSSTIPPSPKGTPAGTYTATVTATSRSLSQQAMLTVIVQ
jgi:FG-GAP-like repeat/Abnormal spindle-like microcephaly-assoc'd, ASPM-SPD-2-Hydin